MSANWRVKFLIIALVVLSALAVLLGCQMETFDSMNLPNLVSEKQITHGKKNHILTNTGVWSPDGEWIVYDTRSDEAGDDFDGESIEMVNVHTGEIREVYRAKNEAHCGVATFHPHENKIVFILGPENPTAGWS